MKKLETKNNFSKLRILRIVALILGTAIFFSLIAPALAGPIEDKRNELLQIQQKIADQKKLIEAKKQEISTLEGQLSAINEQIRGLELQIEATELEIEKVQMEIEVTNKDIAIKEEEIVNQKKILGSLMREIYKQKNNDLLFVILSSENFSDLVSRMEYLSAMQIKSADTLKKIKKMKEELEEKKKELEVSKQDLEKLKSQRQEEESALEGQRAFKVQILDQTKGEEAVFQEQLSKARAEEQSISAAIIKLVQEEEAKRRRATTPREKERGPVNSGGFGYPLAGENRISIIGGDFMDPAYGMGFPHTGVDLAAAQGTAVYAAGDGTVLIARDSGGPGLSYVAIDHGNGLITKYLHLSAIYVNSGDPVAKGTIIGLSGGMPGSRGAGIFTTGPHLHFEINDYSGAPVNPHLYLYIAPPLM